MNAHKRKKLAKIAKYNEMLKQKELTEKTIVENKVETVQEKPVEQSIEQKIPEVVAKPQAESQLLKKKKVVNEPV